MNNKIAGLLQLVSIGHHLQSRGPFWKWSDLLLGAGWQLRLVAEGGLSLLGMGLHGVYVLLLWLLYL